MKLIPQPQQNEAESPPSVPRLAMLAPGILVAATGVGAGDLLTASLGGSAVGLAILWAAVVGAVLKWFLNEGIARWQMATGTTLLEGWTAYFGRGVRWAFLIYLLIWSVFTGGALVNACGVAGAALWPGGMEPSTSKIVWGMTHSFIGLLLVWVGGYQWVTKIMPVCIGVMFVSVIVTAIGIKPNWSEVGSGLVKPAIPAGGAGWVLGILGGVGGTVTLLSYGYWIREAGRSGRSGVTSCRIDLAVGYALTAAFGVSMIVIGSRVEIAKGATLVTDLANQLATVMGPAGKWIFLIGFWGAVFSSLLGVWQSVPYLFADFVAIGRGISGRHRQAANLAETAEYRWYLAALTTVSLPLLWIELRRVQLAYAVMGALFMPLLSMALLIMNNQARWVGRRYCSGWVTNGALLVTMVLFLYIGVSKATDSLSRWVG